MAIPAASAAGAYSSIARLTGGMGDLAKPAKDGGGGSDFGALVKQAMSAVVESGHKADAQTQAVAAGKANVVDVVTAVAETEVAIDALVSVRDRVIRSYEEILKMPI
jgi:flagellar hook-basal body complex protein FliE